MRQRNKIWPHTYEDVKICIWLCGEVQEKGQ